MTPSGSEQILSLKWALEQVAKLDHQLSVSAISELVGIPISLWEANVSDENWFIGDRRWRNREAIEISWNTRYAKMTKVWLDENAWLRPLWQLWLPDKKMVFAANLTYLLGLQERGARTELAKFIGRNPTTASRWGNWQEQGKKVRVPPQTAMPRVLEFFGLRPSLDLTETPLFLGRSELRDDLLRIQGQHYLHALSGNYLQQAVQRLSEEFDRQSTNKINSKTNHQ